MAKITVGLGVIRTAEEEDSWRRLAADIPDDWDITIVGHGVFDVCITGPGVYAIKTFAANGSSDVLRYLETHMPAKP